MTVVSAEKPATQSRLKFIIGGVLIIAAIGYLIISSTRASAQYYLSVEELVNKGTEMVGKNVRISGVVLGETIQNNTDKMELSFVVAHIPADNAIIEQNGGLAQVLHDAILDKSLPRLNVIYLGVKPDLLKNEAQAIMTGRLGEDGTFYADELLLKCPTKYEEAVPDQVEN